jgi:hypothetical protein
VIVLISQRQLNKKSVVCFCLVFVPTKSEIGMLTFEIQLEVKSNLKRLNVLLKFFIFFKVNLETS